MWMAWYVTMEDVVIPPESQEVIDKAARQGRKALIAPVYVLLALVVLGTGSRPSAEVLTESLQSLGGTFAC